MININKFCIIGGDKRQIFLGKSMMKDGKNVVYYGFDKADEALDDYSDLEKAIDCCDCVILPMPLSKDGKTLFMPLSDRSIAIDEKLFNLIHSKVIFCTNSRLLMQSGDYAKCIVYDYLNREELAVLNAVPTAEGAIEIAMSHSNRTINSASCLVAGYGRIGKVLSRILAAMGANVTVSARKLNDLTWIRLNGYNPIATEDISLGGGYDFIFNTVPSLIFDRDTLNKTAANALVIDLASAPGGVDFTACEKLGINAVHALSLPGKVAPKTAGEIIKNTIYNIIEEESP